MSSSFRILFALAALCLPATLTKAADPAATEAQGIIAAQIDAFQHDDGAKAYSFASPDIHLMFPNPDIFMSMVRGGYAPVYHPQQFQFGSFTAGGDMLKQIVEITAADGTAWTAEYTLTRLADGSLKISGCRLTKRPGVGA
jgi:hypothetical protein